MNKCYNELIKLQTFEERLEYLQTHSAIGDETFGFDRYMNRMFYKSAEWQRARRNIITRDMGNDMGLDNHPIRGGIIIHHINPITPEDIENSTEKLLDPNNLISVSLSTHNAIHYGLKPDNEVNIIDRKPGDTCPWKR